MCTFVLLQTVVELKFTGDFETLKNDESFTLGVRTDMADSAKVHVDNVKISNMRSGSIIMDVEVGFPEGVEDKDIRAFNELIEKEPEKVFGTSFKNTYGVPESKITATGKQLNNCTNSHPHEYIVHLSSKRVPIICVFIAQSQY